MTLQDRCSNPILPVAVLSGAIALGYSLATSTEALAACTQTGRTVDCTGVDGDGFLSTQSLTVHVQPDALIGNIVSRNVTGRCPLSQPGLSLGASSNVVNEGTISTFGVCAFGIMVENGSTVTNTGTILTHDLISYGILTGDNVSVRTSGRIATDYQGSGGIFGGDGMRVAVETGGTITTGGIAGNGIEVGVNAQVVNNGAILARGDASAGISVAAGSILANSGSVETTGNNSIGIQIVNADLTNAGRIRSVLAGPALALTPTVGVSVVGPDAHFRNTIYGLVEATHIGVRLDGARSAGFSNDGRIDVFAAKQIDGTNLSGGAAILVTGHAPVEIVNSGTITARDGLAALKSLGPEVAFSNGGTVNGDILLSAGNDVVTFRAGSAINGTLDFGAGEDLLLFLGGSTLNTPILNAEILSKNGGGNLVVARDIAIRQQVNIFDGSAITLNPGVRLTSAATGNLGLLRGTGTIDGTVSNDGIIAPGTHDGKGALTVTGAFQQSARGTLAIRLSPDGSSDQLIVGGPATLAGTLAVSYEGTAFQNGQRFDVLTPLSGVLPSTGKLALAAPELAFVKAAMVTTTSGALAVQIDRLSYSTAGVTAAQQQVGRLFDRLQASPPAALSATLAQLDFSTPDGATAILEDFAAETPGGIQNLGLLTLERLTQGLRHSAPVETLTGHSTWARGFSSTGRSRGGASVADFDVRGVIAGMDMTAGETRLGIVAARTDGDFARGTADASLNTSLVAVTAGTRWDDFEFEAAIAYGHGAPELRRVRTRGGRSDSLATSADSDLWSAYFEANHEKIFGPVIFSPHFGASYNRVGLSAIDEGQALATRTSHDALNSLRVRLGADVSGAAGRIRPYGDLSLSTELLQRMPRISARLNDVPGSDFELYGDARRRLAVDAQAGLAITITSALEGYVAGTMTANDLLAGHTLTAGLTYRW